MIKIIECKNCLNRQWRIDLVEQKFWATCFNCNHSAIIDTDNVTDCVASKI